MNGKCDLCDSDDAELEWFGRKTRGGGFGLRICGACKKDIHAGVCGECGRDSKALVNAYGQDLCRPCAVDEYGMVDRCVDCGILSDSPQPLVKSSHDLMLRCQPCHDERVEALEKQG